MTKTGALLHHNLEPMHRSASRSTGLCARVRENRARRDATRHEARTGLDKAANFAGFVCCSRTRSGTTCVFVSMYLARARFQASEVSAVRLPGTLYVLADEYYSEGNYFYVHRWASVKCRKLSIAVCVIFQHVYFASSHVLRM